MNKKNYLIEYLFLGSNTKKPHLNNKKKSDLPTDTIYTKKATSFAFIVKPSATINGLTNYDSDEEFERTKQISNQVLVRLVLFLGILFINRVLL